jgi:hypothetical protein
MQKKLQVFISSTYRDLQPERAAAVGAILGAGHMPSGMEAFAAGNSGVWDTIKEWIDACDALLLIVGGRYGEIDSVSGKSFTQLEYEYAQERGKETFALVLSPKALDAKSRDLGKDGHDDHGDKLKAFREMVLKKMSALVDDPKDIKYEVMKTLIGIDSRDRAVGWVSGHAVKQLQEENAMLRARAHTEPVHPTSLNIPTETLLTILETEVITLENDVPAGLVDALLQNVDRALSGVYQSQGWIYDHLMPRLTLFDLAEKKEEEDPRESFTYTFFELTPMGRATIILLKAKRAGVILPSLA